MFIDKGIDFLAQDVIWSIVFEFLDGLGKTHSFRLQMFLLLLHKGLVEQSIRHQLIQKIGEENIIYHLQSVLVLHALNHIQLIVQ